MARVRDVAIDEVPEDIQPIYRRSLAKGASIAGLPRHRAPQKTV